MKLKTTSLIMTASAMLLAAACSGEKNTEPEKPDGPGTEKNTTVFSATVDAAGTKTYLGDKNGDGWPVLWSEGDRISVNGVISKPLAAEEAGSSSASYTVEEKLDAPYTGIYPASARVSDNVVAIPSQQSPAQGGFDPAAAVMVAGGESTGLEFRQLCAYLRITIQYPDGNNDFATRAVFRGNASETVAGNFGFTVSGGNASISGVSGEGDKALTITSKDGGLTTFCIAMPPQTFGNGFTLEFYNAKGSAFLKASTSSAVEVKQGVILGAPDLKFTSLKNTTSDLEEVGGTGPGISWGTPVLVSGWCSAYGRARRLDDGRLMISYSNTWTARVRFSSDDGATWSAAKDVVKSYKSDDLTYRMDNPEFAQLSATNPHHPGRIIFAVNERVTGADGKAAYPYHISVCTSDDRGATWSSLVKLYSSNSVSGCYEPFVLELPDGTVQIYFADETPYAYDSITYQNISVIESKDGGETWGSKRIVSYAYGCRDGMPTATIFDGNIYVAVEANGNGALFYPQIVYTPVSENWKATVGINSAYRFDPFKVSLASKVIYSGAPYLIQTDNWFVLSYQTTGGAPQSTHAERYKHTAMEVQLCPKNEMSGAKFTTMRGVSRPFSIDQKTACAKWNSLCPLGGDEILAVYGSGGSGHEGDTGFLYVVKGRITTSALDMK